MKKPKFLNLFKSFIYLSLVVVFISCGTSSSDEEESCIKNCPVDFSLNEDTCECEPIPCTTTCASDETLNEDSCECEPTPCTLTCASDEILNEDTCKCEVFVARVIEIDAAMVTLTDDWKIKKDIADYTGDGYVVWEGPGQTWKGTVGEKGQLTYKVTIPKAGTYLFQWRSYIAKKAADDAWAEHNDSWLKIESDDFFAKKDGSILYPKGSGKSPNPAGENGNGFFKIYMNTLDQWSTISSTSDNNAHQVYAKFDEEKEYTVIIAARSDYHAIDSFKLIEQKPE
ncbi:hypothetical protein [Polaribacter sp. SA4-12]|uniref:hypothetical protein n=1 Tax=Polaribacter sp. SA4-12 TaxID=1312072 RepID=UPI000B3CA961|nr:hypothetical protein [Polaribacter sp. SA4-12]ARV16535.1 hypothetical protein BTO07_15935 [Polaribacter sp. SA4-12]